MKDTMIKAEMNAIDVMGAVQCLMADKKQARNAAEKMLIEWGGQEALAAAANTVQAKDGQAAADLFGDPDYAGATSRLKAAVKDGRCGTDGAAWLYRTGEPNLMAIGKEIMAKKLHKFVYGCAKKWYPTRFEKEADDLFSCGMIGVMKAMERYDGKLAFTTYSKNFIKGEMFDYVCTLNDSSSPYYGGLDFTVDKAASRIEEAGREATVEEVAKKTGFSRQITKQALDARSRKGCLRLDQEDEEGNCLRDLVVAGGESVEDYGIRMFESAMVRNWVSSLDKECMAVIFKKFWEGKSFPEIARERGCDEKETKRIYRTAMTQLRMKASSIA